MLIITCVNRSILRLVSSGSYYQASPYSVIIKIMLIRSVQGSVIYLTGSGDPSHLPSPGCPGLY